MLGFVVCVWMSQVRLSFFCELLVLELMCPCRVFGVVVCSVLFWSGRDAMACCL